MAKKDKQVNEAIEQIEQTESLTIDGEQEMTEPDPTTPIRKHKIRDFFGSKKGKLVIFLLLLAILVGVIAAVPMFRYAATSPFVKRSVSVQAIDSASKKPISGVQVSLGRQDAQTDAKGRATFQDVPVGEYYMTLEKANYQLQKINYTVPIFAQSSMGPFELKATGRVADIVVKNKISGKVLAGAEVKVADATSISDDNGVAHIALAIHDAEQTGSITLDGYQAAQFKISTKDSEPKAEAELTPSGKVYFMSNRSGTLDVMSANLDGSQPEVIFAGTGRENLYDVDLYVSPNQKTIAYLGRRDASATPSLYMIDADSKQVVRVDGDKTSLNMVGWGGDTFYYVANQVNAAQGGDVDNKLMGYNQGTKKTVVYDESRTVDHAGSVLKSGISQVAMAGGQPYYITCWRSLTNWYAEFDQKAQIKTVVDNKAISLKSANQTKSDYCMAVANKPNRVYFQISNAYNGQDSQYFKYQLGGEVEIAQLSEADFTIMRTDYFLSPNGSRVFWTESRDNKPMSFISKLDGSDQQQDGGGDKFYAVGWAGDDYVLFSKNSNELHIMSADGGPMLKITDYYEAMSKRRQL